MTEVVPSAPSAPSIPSMRSERRAAAAALAAELGHDLQGPLNLFRSSVDRLARGEALDDEDLTLVREELQRLSQLSARLRELARTPLQRVRCTPRQILELALSSRQLSDELELSVPDQPSYSLACDPQLLSRALGELVDNALEARAERAGVRFEAESGGRSGFCVWDDGAGFELELGLELTADAALGWGVTTRPGAAGLGLTLALRAARAHGFSLELRRAPPHTEAWLLIPARELNTKDPK